jgi:ribonuclease HI
VKEAAGYGVYFGQNNSLNVVARTVGEQTLDNLELQAVLKALELTMERQNIHIIMDNEVVRILVNKFTDNTGIWDTCTKRTIERCIKDTINERAAKGGITRCTHVYSHIVKKKIECKYNNKWNKRFKTMKEKWGDLFSMIVKGNEGVDGLVRQGMEMTLNPVYTRINNEGINIGVYVNGNWINSSVQKYVKDRNETTYRQGLKEKICVGIATPEEVAWKIANNVTHKPNYKIESNAHIIYKLQLRRSQIAQHQQRYRRRSTPDMGTAVNEEDNMCPLCAQNDIHKTKDNGHLLGECQTMKVIRDEVLKKIMDNLEAQLDDTYSFQTWIGDNCLKKAAILLRLLPTEWATRIQRANAKK